jgi:hypothetical protein
MAAVPPGAPGPLADDFPLIDLSSQMLPSASLMSCANTTYYRPSSLHNTLASFTAQQLILYIIYNILIFHDFFLQGVTALNPLLT